MASRQRGLVVPISAEDNTGRAFDAVNEKVKALQDEVRRLRSLVSGGGPGKDVGDGFGHAVPEIAAASGAIREFEGTLPIRAVERFLSTTLGLGPILAKAFPLVGGIAFGEMIVEQIERLVEFYQQASKAGSIVARAYRDIHTEAALANDELQVTNDRLENDISKLEHKPQNNLALALDEARKAADDLAKSLEADQKRSEDLLKQNAVGRISAFFTGRDSTVGIAGSVNYYRGQIADAGAQAQEATRRGDQAALEAANKKLAQARTGYANWLNAEIAKRAGGVYISRTPTSGGRTVPYATLYGDQTQNLNILRGERTSLDDESEREARKGKNAQLDAEKSRVEGLKGQQEYGNKLNAASQRLETAKASLAEADNRAAAAREKAEYARQLDELESQHKRLEVSETDYYRRRQELQDAQSRSELNRNAKDRSAQEARLAALPAAGVSEVERKKHEADIYEIKAEIAKIDAKDAAIVAEQAKNAKNRADAEYDASRRRTSSNDGVLSALETAKGGSVESRLRQNDDEYQQRRAELIALNGGSGGAAVSALDAQHAIDTSKIEALGARQDYDAVGSGINAKRTAASDAYQRGAISSLELRRQQIALDREEAAALQPVLEKYEALARVGDQLAISQVEELKTKIAELSDPVNEVAAQVRGQLNGAFESLFENLDRGAKAWQEFGRAIERTLLQSVYKQAIEPSVQNVLGALIPNGNKTSPSPSKAAALSGLIPSIPGLPGVAAKGGGGAVTVQIINQSPIPLQGTASQQGRSDDGFESRVVTVLMKGMEEGSSWAQALMRGVNF